MHRRMRDHLEEVLGDSLNASAQQHLKECAECREQIEAMREQAELLRKLRPPADSEPRPGFYARVMERIETQGAGSIWSLVFDSSFGRRIAVASMALALLIGVYLFSSEELGTQQPMVITGQMESASLADDILDPAGVYNAQPAAMLSSSDRDAIFVNLVTYQEQ